MRVFEEEITVSKNDLDELNHVNNVIYIHWVQEIAKIAEEELNKKIKGLNKLDGLLAISYSSSKEIINNYYWVLLEHHIKYINPALLDDKIRLKTYIEKTEGLKSSRVVEIYNVHNNKLLVNSKTLWCLINATTNKPCRITSEIRNAFDQ